MVRLALLLCYLVATLGGSRPCCCAAPVKPLAPPATSAPVKQQHSCPLCAATEKQPEPAKKPDLPAKKRHCPCPKAVAHAPAVPPAPDDRPFAPADGVPAVTAPVAVLGRVVRAIRPGPPPDPSPHLLALTHRLRC